MLELTVRLVFSLAVVIGLLLLIAKFSARRFRSSGGATIQVIHRQALTRSSAVSVVSVGGRVLVLGSTEQQINLLAELDPDELELDEPAPDLTILESPRTIEVADVQVDHLVRRGAHKAPGARKAPRRAATHEGALTGSILSIGTWRQAVAAVRRAS